MTRYFLSLLIMGVIAGCGVESAETPSEPASIEATQTPAHTRFTVETIGDGQDVILIPGLASHPDVYAQTVEQLKDGYRFHLVHIAGFAGAPAAGNEGEADILIPLSQEIATYAGDLDHKPAIIGHSLGGLVAISAVREAPQLFERIMVIDVLPFFSVMIDPEATEETIIPTATALKATLYAQSDETYEVRQREGLAALTKSEDALETSLQWSLETDRSVMAEAMYDVLTTDLRNDIENVAIPLTVLYARDPLIPHMQRIEQQYVDAYKVAPNAVIRPIDGALHFIMYDQPEKFQSEVETFLGVGSGLSDWP